MSTLIKVESGIPIPEKSKKCKYPWSEMKAGDSFFVPCENADAARKKKVSLHGAAMRKCRVIIRTESNGVRVWKTGELGDVA